MTKVRPSGGPDLCFHGPERSPARLFPRADGPRRRLVRETTTLSADRLGLHPEARFSLPKRRSPTGKASGQGGNLYERVVGDCRAMTAGASRIGALRTRYVLRPDPGSLHNGLPPPNWSGALSSALLGLPHAIGLPRRTTARRCIGVPPREKAMGRDQVNCIHYPHPAGESPACG